MPEGGATLCVILPSHSRVIELRVAAIALGAHAGFGVKVPEEITTSHHRFPRDDMPHSSSPPCRAFTAEKDPACQPGVQRDGRSRHPIAEGLSRGFASDSLLQPSLPVNDSPNEPRVAGDAEATTEPSRRYQTRMLKEAETRRIASLPRDPKQWGGWHREVHASGLQLNRQYRAYFICEDDRSAIGGTDGEWTIRGYHLSLDGCGCPDFTTRRVPCKHIYAAALLAGQALALPRGQYAYARRQSLTVVFTIEEALKPTR